MATDMTPLPISVIIRTLNEEENIRGCVACCLATNPLEVIVSDGGSHDATCRIVQDIRGITLVNTTKGLATQRDAGIRAASPESEYIAIVDADDRLAPNCLQHLLRDLESTGAVAVQAKHESISTHIGRELTYWEQAMLINLKIIRELDRQRDTPIIMVGRPALYRKQALIHAIESASAHYTSAAEDADLSYKLMKNGGRFTIGSGVTYRKHLRSFPALCRRWFAYGIGDAKFIETHPERKAGVLHHLLVTYPVQRSCFCASRYHIKYSLFFILQGAVRFMGLSYYSMRRTILSRAVTDPQV